MRFDLRGKFAARRRQRTSQKAREHLMTQGHFRAAFDAQKARLREVDIRVVEEVDPNRQALLEMYASIALRTPYNDFGNH